MRELQKRSDECSDVYEFIDYFAEMLDEEGAYIRIRSMTLIAANAKWDADNKINKIVNNFLKHITDSKPIVARECIQLLPTIAESKPELMEIITSALQNADVSKYKESMRPLIEKDIQESLEIIENDRVR